MSLDEALRAAIGESYDIVREMGGAGMSRVFLADERALGRRVVVKVLAGGPAGPDAAERFRREVRVAARLQHPHIVPVLTSGALPDGTLYYTMPYVDGDSLAARLAAEGALPVADAVKLLRDAADALAFAHAQRIVHRDIKPANILVSAGSALVTDFGIAKALRALRSGATGEEGAGTTAAATITEVGMALGTPQYMAPEQATADQVDHRADLYALGVVAYEMLTGRPPFEGRTSQQLLAAHAVEVPDSVTRRRPAVPEKLANLVASLLAKNPADRPQSADAVRHDLDMIARLPELPAHGPGTLTSVSRGRGLRHPVTIATCAAISGALVMRIIDRAPPTGQAPAGMARPVVASLTLPAGVEVPSFLSNTADRIVVSPDGTRLAVVASDAEGRSSVWIREFSQQALVRVPGTEGANGAFWKPDGSAIGFFANGQLRVIELGSGSTRSLCPSSFAGGGAWLPSGEIVFSPNFVGPLYRVRSSGGACLPLTTLTPGSFGHRTPTALPDGRHVLFNSSRGDTALMVDIETRAVAVVRTGTRDARFVSPDWLLYVAEENGALLAQRFDFTDMRPTGDAMRLVDRVYSPNGVSNYSAAPGVMVTAESPLAGSNSRVIWVNRQGVVIDSMTAPDGVRRIALSRDGGRLALIGTGLWIYDRERRVTTRVTNDPVPGRQISDAAWSPGDSAIAFGTSRAGPLMLRQYRPESGTSDSLFTFGARIVGEPTWSPDGRDVAFTLFAGAGTMRHEVWRYSFTSRSARPLLSGAGNLSSPAWSSDPRWLAYSSDESGSREVYIHDLVEGRAPLRVSVAGGGFPRWRGDGRELYFMRPNGDMMSVPVTLGTAVKVGTPSVVLVVQGFARLDRGPEVSRDGSQFVSFARGVPAPMTVIFGWEHSARR